MAYRKGPKTSGGPRKGPNIGRPKGAKNKRTVEIAIAAVEAGITPIEVLLKIMRESHDEWQSIKKDIELIEQVSDPGDEEAQKQLKDMRSEMKAARKVAHEAAVDAAPYSHPRMAALEVTGANGGAIKTDKRVEVEFLGLPDGSREHDDSRIIDITPEVEITK